MRLPQLHFESVSVHSGSSVNRSIIHKYIFKVLEATLMISKDDLIAMKHPGKEDTEGSNGPIHQKTNKTIAHLLTKNLTEVEVYLLLHLVYLAQDVLEGRKSEDFASKIIEEAFQTSGRGLCAKFPRLDKNLCPPSLASRFQNAVSGAGQYLKDLFYSIF
ncbi:hypothetical protein Q1695_013439 [Nippostrongylus brasiliensis]|nr:hypothetical protein Q1695_013439 [Nippostrongylus brasiliensis]